MGASGWEAPPESTLWPYDQSTCYSSTNRSLAAGIQSVHDIRDAEPTDIGGYNLMQSGPYLRESLFEMAIQSGNSIQGFIEGLQTMDLAVEYDPTYGPPHDPSTPLVSYQNMFEAEAIVIDVYRVGKLLTVTPY